MRPDSIAGQVLYCLLLVALLAGIVLGVIAS